MSAPLPELTDVFYLSWLQRLAKHRVTQQLRNCSDQSLMPFMVAAYIEGFTNGNVSMDLNRPQAVAAAFLLGERDRISDKILDVE